MGAAGGVGGGCEGVCVAGAEGAVGVASAAGGVVEGVVGVASSADGW